MFSVGPGLLSDAESRDKLMELITVRLAKPGEEGSLMEDYEGVPCRVSQKPSIRQARERERERERQSE